MLPLNASTPARLCFWNHKTGLEENFWRSTAFADKTLFHLPEIRTSKNVIFIKMIEKNVPVLQVHFPGQLFWLGKSGGRVGMDVFLEFFWADPANLRRSRPSRTNEIHLTTGLCIYRY